jgi:hypothetical protein
MLTNDERETLERWARRPRTAQALAQRARIVLACVSGRDNSAVAVEARVTRQTVGRWRRRFVEHGGIVEAQSEAGFRFVGAGLTQAGLPERGPLMGPG